MPDTSSSVVRQNFNYGALIWFAGSLLVLVCSALLSVKATSVILPWLNAEVPETCMMRARFGIDCPGCGLTRSFIHIAHLRPSEAAHLNWVSFVVFGYVLVQLPLSIAHWRMPDSQRANHAIYKRLIWWNERFLIVIALLLVARWTWRLMTGDLLLAT